MSANRIKITLSTATSKKSGVTFKTPVPIHPGHLDEAVEQFGEYLKHLAGDKKKLKILFQGFAQESWDEYMEWYNDFHKL